MEPIQDDIETGPRPIYERDIRIRELEAERDRLIQALDLLLDELRERGDGRVGVAIERQARTLRAEERCPTCGSDGPMMVNLADFKTCKDPFHKTTEEQG